MATMTAEQMIERSVSHAEIVVAPWTAEAAHDLDVASIDSVHDEDRDVVEYVGTTEDGDEWRVHLTGAAKAASAVIRDLVRQDSAGHGDGPDVRTPSRQIAGWLSAAGEAGDGGVVAAIELLGQRGAARVYADASGAE